jgi:hypothetical protein
MGVSLRAAGAIGKWLYLSEVHLQKMLYPSIPPTAHLNPE